MELGNPYEDCSTEGWGEQGHFLREDVLGRALDAYSVRVQECHVISSWEELPVIVKRSRAKHRYNHYRADGVDPAAAHSHGARVYGIQQWELIGARAGVVVDASIATLSVQKAGKQAIMPLSDVLKTSPNVVLKDLPVLLLPKCLPLFGDAWHELVLLARWTAASFPNLCPHF